MKDIAIYGAGGLGREVACLLERINRSSPGTWNLTGFFDDGKKIGEKVSHFGHVLGGLSELNRMTRKLNIVLAIGSPANIRALHSRIVNPNVEYPNLIDPTFFIADTETFSIGKGNIIQGCCVATADVAIGDFNIFNGYVIMGHDVNIGQYNVIMPGAHISGEVSMKSGNLIGASSFVLQRLKIGNDVTLSPMSALLTKPKDGGTYIGNPAKLMKY